MKATTASAQYQVYVESIRDRLQKLIEGLHVLAVFSTKNMLESVEGKGSKKTIGAYLKSSTIIEWV